jgi:HSP20 family molecular chaperone IbpA
VAQRPSPTGFPDAFADFERVFDSLFDDLLISRWRGLPRIAADTQARVADLGDRYEVRMAHPEANARELDIEASDRRLVVRSAGSAGRGERVIDFPHPIDSEATTAELKAGELKVTLPKKRARKIAVG